MAFAQRQRRPPQSLQLSVAASVENSSLYGTAEDLQADLAASPGFARSESDIDWHVISSAMPSSSSQASSVARRDSLSAGVYSSEPESFSSFRLSDAESYSDADTSSTRHPTTIEFSTLPSHDGTGAFSADEGSSSDAAHQDDSDTEAFARVMQRMLEERKTPTWQAHASDFEPDTPSMPNILLPHGGIKPPSFVMRSEKAAKRPSHQMSQADDSSPPSLGSRPTMSDVDSHNVLPSAERLSEQQQQQQQQQQQHQAQLSEAPSDSGSEVQFARPRRRNLDRIPGHHPALPGTMASAAILSALWDQVRRLTTHFLENDANTSETFSTLVSEAALDGCMPFGSHLHMDFGSGLLPTYSSRSHINNL